MESRYSNRLGQPSRLVRAHPQPYQRFATTRPLAQPSRTVSSYENALAPTVLRTLTGGSAGRPLDRRTRDQLESGFGRSLEHVRIHTDDEATRLVAGLGADAFARGFDIYFGQGQASFATERGRRLLAHEVAHTLQPAAPDGGRLLVSEPGAPSESNAERVADRVLAGEAPGELVHASAFLQRQSKTPQSSAEMSSIIFELPNIATIIVQALLVKGDRQGAINQLITSAAQIGRIDKSLLLNGTMTYNPNLPGEGNTPDPLLKREGGYELCQPEIGPTAFSTMPWLYSTILHEYDHVKKLQNPVNRGVANKAQLEVDAYGMEIENAMTTGVAINPTDVAILWDRLRLAYIGLMSIAKRSKKDQVERLFEVAKRLVAKDPKIRLQAP